MHGITTQRDRARGAIVGLAVGDALGAGYEFGSAELGSDGARMIGGGLGGFEPGEWTDDTTMAWCILDVLAVGGDLRADTGLTAVGRRFRQWFDSGPADIGHQTRAVLWDAGPEPNAGSLTATAHWLHQVSGRSAGNGSLMRTAPVALGYLDDSTKLAEAAAKVSALTHFDPSAGEACVIWSEAIRHAIQTGEPQIRSGLQSLATDSAARWSGLIERAEQDPAASFNPNGWVIAAFQAAWAAIAQTPSGGLSQQEWFATTINTAIAIGDDTDTVAAIAGSLAGAVVGAEAIDEDWRAAIHGYPGITGTELVALVDQAIGGQLNTG